MTERKLGAQVPPTPTSPRPVFGNKAVIGIVTVLLLVSASGCGGSPAATGNAAPASAAASAEAGTPVPSGTSLLAISGTGNQSSQPFSASGASVYVTWTYDCASASVAPGASPGMGAFTLNFYGAEGSPALADQLDSEFGANGSGSATEALNGATGPFHVEVDSGCSWTVKVIGAP